jgi:hypothetical protein
MTDDDRDLHEIFAAVRREEEAHVPPISLPPVPHLSQTARAHRRLRLSGKLAVAATCLAALIAAAVWLLPGSHVARERPNRVPDPAAASLATWKPATDFLLDTPGRELLQGVPDIGDGPGVANAPRPSKSHRPFKKHSLP